MCVLTVLLKPKYAPMKVSGTEMQNHRAKMATSVPKGMAAEDPSHHRIRFIRKKSANTTLHTHTHLGLNQTLKGVELRLVSCAIRHTVGH